MACLRLPATRTARVLQTLRRQSRRVGKAIASAIAQRAKAEACPPQSGRVNVDGGHASLCPPYERLLRRRHGEMNYPFLHTDYVNFIFNRAFARWLIRPTGYVAKDFIRI